MERSVNILVAPCSFKGSLTAVQAANAIADGLRRSGGGWTLDLCPLADGGEGSLAVLSDQLGGELRSIQTLDALGRPRIAEAALLPGKKAAVVETAGAIGLPWLSPEQRDPGAAHSYGAGMLVKAALDWETEELWISLGGSATVDGGMGLLAALGAKFLDERGQAVHPSGLGLAEVDRADFSGLDPRLRERRLIALCDVRAPLLGSKGARMYMRQKGADLALCRRLSQNLAHWRQVMITETGVDMDQFAGAGAAGGLGGALAVLEGRLTSGAAFIFEALDLESRLQRAGMAFTGEGSIDRQTLEGKALGELASTAKRLGKPLTALCGRINADPKQLRAAGFTAVFSVVPGPMSESKAMTQAGEWLRNIAEQAGRLIVSRP